MNDGLVADVRCIYLSLTPAIYRTISAWIKDLLAMM